MTSDTRNNPKSGPPDDDRTVIRPSAAPRAAAPARAPVAVPVPAAVPLADDNGGIAVGTQLHEFEITRLVGEGGFGLVYEAYDHSLQRRVALKEYMPSSLASRSRTHQVTVKSERHRDTFQAGLKSFVNEARLLASFDHPSLIKVYRFWEDNGTAYMVMPFLEGVTLKDHLRQLGAPPDEAWLRALLGPLTEALGVIHARQCFHRDIAPDNVMLLPDGHKWLLLDFGAARRVIGDMTQALTVILKPGYAPVEQYAEIPGLKQGAWTDVYALAASVYFAIMGKTPPPSVGRLLNDTYVPLVQAAAGRYSHDFLAAIDRALAVRPEARTPSVEALRQQLRLDGSAAASTARGPAPVPARPAGKLPAAGQPGSAPRPALPSASQGGARSKAPWLALAGAALVLLLALLAYRLLAPPSRAAAPVAAEASSPVVVPVADVGASAAAPAMPGLATPVAQTPAPSSAPSSAPPITAPSTAPSAAAGLDPVREFDRVLQARHPAFAVQAQAKKTTLRIDRDELAFSVRAEREGYLYVLAYGADGSLLQLLPNTLGGTVRLRAGQTFNFPTGDGVALGMSDPPGPGRLLVMVSTRQRDFTALEPVKNGAFRTFPTGADAAAIVARHQAGGSASQPVLTGQVICPAAGVCEDDYGAALIVVDVVR